MAKIIKAECTTSSAEDSMGRVKLKADGIWSQETELVQSVNGCALNKGDIVFVSIADGYYNPLILGKADRNNVVLELLVDRINSLEDKMNEAVKQQNNILNQLKNNPKLVVDGGWAGGTPEAFGLMTTVETLPTKTTVRDIQDNYKK